MDRLVEMLAWRNLHEIEIRRHPAAIVKHLVHFTRNCSRLMAIVGSLDNIVSLLRFDDEDLTTHCTIPFTPYFANHSSTNELSLGWWRLYIA